MEKMITRILICIVVLFTTIIAFSHTVWSHGVNIIGQARAEYVYEPYPGLDSATTIQGHVERGDNPISGPGSWTWMAISLSDVPSGEDCHTGSINSSSYYVLRAGWMKYNHPAWGNGDQPYMMAAAKTISGVSLIKYGPFDHMYPLKINQPSVLSPNRMDFLYYNSGTSAWIIYSCIGCYENWGGSVPFRCTTFGGWASSSSHNMGNVGIFYPIYRAFSGSTYYNVPLNPPTSHAVIASDYLLGASVTPPLIQVQDN